MENFYDTPEARAQWSQDQWNHERKWAQADIDRELPTTVSWITTDWLFVKDKIKIKKLLGYGVQGTVWLVLNEVTRRNHVAKLNKNSRNIAEKTFFVNFLQREHPHIVSLQAFVDYDSLDARRDDSVQLPLYFEYCTGGDLEGLIDLFWNKGQNIPEGFIWHVFVQLAEVLAFLHGVLYEDPNDLPIGDHDPKTIQPKKGFFHNDIKPSNIMLMWKANDFERKEYPDIKLGDFGLWWPFEVPDGKTIEDVQLPCYQVAVPYLAPEMSTGARNGFTVKTEVWNLGATIHALGHLGMPPLELRLQELMDLPAAEETVEKPERGPGRPPKRLRLDSGEEEDREPKTKPKRAEKQAKTKPKRAVDRFEQEDMNNRYTRRIVTDLPFQYTEILNETMKTALTLDPSARPNSAKLFVNVWKLAKARKDIMFRSFPAWARGNVEVTGSPRTSDTVIGAGRTSSEPPSVDPLRL
ncbi:G2-specific serine/threonine protein kinase [Xylographa bjoerkii]|nr:G2-specific serine/threonine protein kinase [Xylographa bjoerkii]